MPKVILKMKYPKSSDVARKYLQYISTREGVAVIHTDKDIASQSYATKKQVDVIKEILEDYPDLKNEHEYQDYKKNPSKWSATQFINIATSLIKLENAPADKYLQYISERPGVSKTEAFGDGLFNAVGKADLQSEKTRVLEHDGRVWHMILSIRREDAENLNLESPEAWRSQLNILMPKLALEMGITLENLRWNAAYHDEGHHPHVHVQINSEDPKELDRKFIRSEDLKRMRTMITKELFKDELKYLYEQKNLAREHYEKGVYQKLEKMKNEFLGKKLKLSDELYTLIKLAIENVDLSKGKSYYSYLSSEQKVYVDAIVSQLVNQDMKKFIDAYIQAEVKIRSMYHNVKDDELDQMKQQMLSPHKNQRKVVHNHVVNLLKELQDVFPQSDAQNQTSPDKNSSEDKKAVLENTMHPPNEVGQVAQHKEKQIILPLVGRMFYNIAKELMVSTPYRSNGRGDKNNKPKVNGLGYTKEKERGKNYGLQI